MIPLRDDNPSDRVPVVTITLIALNVLVFMYEISLSTGRAHHLIEHWGLTPSRLIHDLHSHGGTFQNTYLPIFTAMFLHGGWMHVIGNMWYLWLFGDNVEDRLGHGRFLFLYLVCGVAAQACEVAIRPHADVPGIGASGAIAGVLGAYLVCFPGARILTLLPVIFVWSIVEVPAVFILGFWFVLQLLNGVMGEMGGIAWWAHIGGFVAGMILILVIPPRRSYRRVRQTI